MGSLPAARAVTLQHWSGLGETTVELTDSQAEQLRTFLEEQGSERFEILPAPNLPEGYVEAVLLDPEGNATATKRVLFPT